MHVCACFQTSRATSCLALVPLSLHPHSLQSFVLSPDKQNHISPSLLTSAKRSSSLDVESELLCTVSYSESFCFSDRNPQKWRC